jgi:hypothetical protein
MSVALVPKGTKGWRSDSAVLAKQVYENLARQWRELAKQAESHERASEGAPGNQLPGHASFASRAMSRIRQFLVALASTQASARGAWPPHTVRR